jgi:hypothetical protein
MAILFNYFEVIVVVCELSKTMIRNKRTVNPKVYCKEGQGNNEYLK